MPDINVNKLSEALNTKADIDLNNTGVFSTSGGWVNLTSSTPADAIGKEVTTADFIKSDIQSNLLNYTTNRILEIPQDIKLELNNGTLTLKAGSKVYALDGSSYTIPSDKTLSYSNAEPHSSWILVKENGEMDDIWTLEKLSTISIGSKWVTFRETNYYLPIGLATHNADGTTKTGWKSIDQVFNGLGYIGSTLFLLPGVKTVVPDGRNDDGTCKNKSPSTVTSVKTETISRAYTGYMFTNYASSVIATHHYVCSKTKPTVTATTLWYNPETNLPSQVLSDGTVMTPYEEIPIAKFTSDSTGKITSFEPFTVDSVVNSNASNFSQAGRSYLSGMGMPSNKYINLTLGATGATYTAPANGWFTINKHSTPGKLAAFENVSAGKVTWIAEISKETDCRVSCPARTGDIVTLWYSADGNLNFFRFIYAQGDQ